MAILNELVFWGRNCVCYCLVNDPTPQAICRAREAPVTLVAVSMFIFGCWMLLLGAALTTGPLLRGRWARTVQQLAALVGFPAQPGAWSKLFGVAIASFGLFYFAAALLEIRVFFWMSVFGRLGVFAVCVLLSWRHHVRTKGGTPQPTRLLILALPDLFGSVITACLLLQTGLSRIAFVGGAFDLVLAVAFFTFPTWLMTLLAMSDSGETWNHVLGALFAFFGAYGIAAAVAGMFAIAWIAIVSRIAMCLALILFGRRHEPGSAIQRGDSRLRRAALLELTVTLCAVFLVTHVG